ncbi:hypothetical protein F4780DRAFT_654367 [Xylariomycetidae sp. FL0641]|nr:hypothetical protein F4780DRAFT_654367 [Xylariomycetidae sp. FL0641]
MKPTRQRFLSHSVAVLLLEPTDLCSHGTTTQTKLEPKSMSTSDITFKKLLFLLAHRDACSLLVSEVLQIFLRLYLLVIINLPWSSQASDRLYNESSASTEATGITAHSTKAELPWRFPVPILPRSSDGTHPRDKRVLGNDDGAVNEEPGQNEDELNDITNNLNNATFQAVKFMMGLVGSIESLSSVTSSLSSKVSSLEAETSTATPTTTSLVPKFSSNASRPLNNSSITFTTSTEAHRISSAHATRTRISGPFPTITRTAHSMGSNRSNSVPIFNSSSKPPSSFRPGITTTSQIVKVIPITTNGSVSMSAYTTYQSLRRTSSLSSPSTNEETEIVTTITPSMTNTITVTVHRNNSSKLVTHTRQPSFTYNTFNMSSPKTPTTATTISRPKPQSHSTNPPSSFVASSTSSKAVYTPPRSTTSGQSHKASSLVIPSELPAWALTLRRSHLRRTLKRPPLRLGIQQQLGMLYLQAPLRPEGFTAPKSTSRPQTQSHTQSRRLCLQRSQREASSP